MSATLLLIPGLLNTPRIFDGVRQHWQGSAELRVADIRGPADLVVMAAACWAAVADLPLAQPLLVAGFSLGGYVALQMLAQPQRPVQGLGLICTSARADTPDGAQFRVKAIAAMERDFDRYVNGLASFLISPTLVAQEELKQTLRSDMRDVGAATAIAQNRAAAGRLDSRELLKTLQLPSLVLGASEDKVTPPELSREMAALLPNTTLQLLEGAGHLVPLEQPAALAQALQSLVAHVLAAPASNHLK